MNLGKFKKKFDENAFNPLKCFEIFEKKLFIAISVYCNMPVLVFIEAMWFFNTEVE